MFYIWGNGCHRKRRWGRKAEWVSHIFPFHLLRKREEGINIFWDVPQKMYDRCMKGEIRLSAHGIGISKRFFWCIFNIHIVPIATIYSWVNLVVPKNWVAYFLAISGRKLDLTTVLRSCWPREWRRRGFLASGPFFSLFLTFAHEKNHFPVVKSGFWGHISH